MFNFNFSEKGLGLVSSLYFVHYILLTEKIPLSDCLYCSKYWAICVLRLFANQAMTS